MSVLKFLRANELFSFILLLLLLQSDSIAVLSVDRIESCLLKESKKNNATKTVEPPMFHLHFGDPAVEIFNAINSTDVRRIKSLRHCVQLEDLSLHSDSKYGTNGTLIHQGNVTYLSGIFQRLLPDIVIKLQIAAQHGIKGTEWDTPNINNLGIRTVQYSAVDTGLKMKSKAQLAKERAEKVHVFSIGEKPKKVDDGSVDLHADEHVVQYMRREHDSAYTMIVHLSSRTEFFGGIVLIGKDERVKDPNETFEGEYDEEDESLFDDWNSTPEKKHEKPEFNAYHTKIQRYTPELGSVLVIRSESSHGVHKVTRGKLNSLILEFWAYADGPVGSRVLSVKDAKPLRGKEEL